MKNITSFLSKSRYSRIYSNAVQVACARIYGVTFPGRPYFERMPKLTLNSRATNSLTVGSDVHFLGQIDLRTRDDARLSIGDRVKLDGPVRIVAAGKNGIVIGDETRIVSFTIINGGGTIRIGRGVIIGPHCTINANEHRFRSRIPVIESGFDHIDVTIGDDVWIGAGVSILPGADIAEGTVIGANSVVNSPTEPWSIYVGSPARKIGERHNEGK